VDIGILAACKLRLGHLMWANVEVTGAARPHRAASRERSERGRPPGWALRVSHRTSTSNTFLSVANLMSYLKVLMVVCALDSEWHNMVNLNIVVNEKLVAADGT